MDNVVSFAIPEPEAMVTSRVNRRWRFDADTNEAVSSFGGVDEHRFSLGDLPNPSIRHCAYIGFTILIGRAADGAAAYAKMMDGDVSRKAKSPKVDNWRLAIAHAIVDATLNSKAPLTLEDAAARVAELTKEEVKSAKMNPHVVTHYNRLTGSNVSIEDFLV